MANLIALPEGYNATGKDPDDQNALPSDELADAIRTAKGRTLLPETTAGGYGDKLTAPRKDWMPQRLGADPPMALVTLRQQVECTVLACFGVPAPLGPMGVNDGTAQREAARRLWTLTVQPLAAMIAEELTRVLEQPVTLDYGQPSGAADLAARARAVGALAKSGVDLDGSFGADRV